MQEEQLLLLMSVMKSVEIEGTLGSSSATMAILMLEMDAMETA